MVGQRKYRVHESTKRKYEKPKTKRIMYTLSYPKASTMKVEHKKKKKQWCEIELQRAEYQI